MSPDGVALGVDVGGTKMLGVALRGDVEIGRTSAPTPHGGPEEIAAGIRGLLFELQQSVGPGSSLGIGVPGMVTNEGVLAFSPHRNDAAGADFATLLGSDAIVVENDANCALRAERQSGAAHGYDDIVLLTLGTGIGGGVVSNGSIVRGNAGFAGEFGHMVVDASGPPCPCGARGCWERFASGSGLARLTLEAACAGRLPELTSRRGGDPESVRGEDVTQAAAAGLEEAKQVMDELGWWLARGIANLVCVLDPEVVVVGGGLSDVAELVVSSANRHLSGLLEGASRRSPVQIVPARHGAAAGAIGAALIGREGR